MFRTTKHNDAVAVELDVGGTRGVEFFGQVKRLKAFGDQFRPAGPYDRLFMHVEFVVLEPGGKNVGDVSVGNACSRLDFSPDPCPMGDLLSRASAHHLADNLGRGIKLVIDTHWRGCAHRSPLISAQRSRLQQRPDGGSGEQAAERPNEDPVSGRAARRSEQERTSSEVCDQATRAASGARAPGGARRLPHRSPSLRLTANRCSAAKTCRKFQPCRSRASRRSRRRSCG